MSNKTQLQTNNNQLDALITRVNAAKDAAASLPDASGGGSARQTFTLKIVFHESYFDFINENMGMSVAQGFAQYTCLGEDGNPVLSMIDAEDALIYSPTEIKIIENVLCDSLFMVQDEYSWDPVLTNESSVGLDPEWYQMDRRSSGDIYGYLIRPCAANTTVVFTFYSPYYDPSSEQ